MPLQQLKRQTSLENMSVRKYGPNRAKRVLHRQQYFSRLAKEQDYNNKLFALSTLGDDEPLSRAANFGVKETEIMAHGDSLHLSRPPPEPYTPLAARKLAKGDWWPTIREVESPNIKDLPHLQPEEDASPSSLRFSEEVAYHLRRQLRACPAHIGENIDWSEFMLDRVFSSRRSRSLYIVWSTITPEARFSLEPHVSSLAPWVKRMIKQRIPRHPTIPQVFFVYNSGTFAPKLPKSLIREVKNVHALANQTIDERVAYLKSLDSLNARARGIPWFMPYLWKKDKSLKQSHSMRDDFKTVEDRKKKAEEKVENRRKDAEVREQRGQATARGASQYTR